MKCADKVEAYNEFRRTQSFCIICSFFFFCFGYVSPNNSHSVQIVEPILFQHWDPLYSVQPIYGWDEDQQIDEHRMSDCCKCLQEPWSYLSFDDQYEIAARSALLVQTNSTVWSSVISLYNKSMSFSAKNIALTDTEATQSVAGRKLRIKVEFGA